MSPRDNLLGDLGLAMQRYQRSVQAFDDAVGRRLGLGPADLRCLDWLADGPKTAGELARATALTPAATTALVDRLARKGYVERYRSDEDRRQVLVRMTTEGAKRTMKLYGPLVDEGQQQLAGSQTASCASCTATSRRSPSSPTAIAIASRTSADPPPHPIARERAKVEEKHDR